MATRSTIALEFADGTIQVVYCHWDGYLDNNGKILQNHYLDPLKVRELIDGGDLSTLSEEIEGCEFYNDREDDDFAAAVYVDLLDYIRNNKCEEYDYILRQVDGKPVWFVRCYATRNEWVTIERAIEAEKECEDDN